MVRVYRIGRQARPLFERGELSAAAAVLTRAITLAGRQWGDANPQSLALMSNLVDVRMALGELSSARELGERVVELSREALGEDHVVTRRAINNLALVL